MLAWSKLLTSDSQNIMKHLHNIQCDQRNTSCIDPLIKIVFDKYKTVYKKNYIVENAGDLKRRLHDVVDDNPFAPPDVKKQMQSMQKLCYQIGPIIVCGVDKANLIHNKRYESAICRTLIMISFTPIDIITIPLIIPTKVKKTFPAKGKPLTPATMNSGLTYVANSEVYVMRDEEMNKVLVHELIHGLKFGIPHSSREHYTLGKQDCETLAIDCSGRHFLDEAYTETLAAILNSIMCACEINLIYNKNIDVALVAKQMLEYETEFGLCQTGHIMSHFSFNKFEDFLSTSSKQIMLQTSDALSYYIFKAALLFNLNDFISFIQKNNTFHVKFSVDGVRVKLFHSLIHKSMRNPKFIQAVNNYINNACISTGKMTIIELS